MNSTRPVSSLKPLLTIIGLVGTLTLPHFAHSVEVDDTSAFYSPMSDSLVVLNAHVNDLLEVATSEAKTCDIDAFESKLLSLLTPVGTIQRLFFGGVEMFAQKSPDIDRVMTLSEDSIYKGSPLERATLVSAGELIKLGGISPSIRLNGQVIGTDKLSHYFETGHELYQEHLRGRVLNDDTLLALIEGSIALEDGYLGMDVTGIKSYGDIQAHFQGALFWYELLSQNSEWLKCESGKLKLRRAFDFNEVVQPGWSEAINCNEYTEKRGWATIVQLFRTPPLPYLEAIRKNTQKLESLTGRRYQCPIVPSGCARSRAKLESILPSSLYHKISGMMSPSCS